VIDHLMKKAFRLLALLAVLAILFVGVSAWALGGGDSHLVVYFALALIAYLCWRVVRVGRSLWLKTFGRTKRQQSQPDDIRPALWLSPRSLRTRGGALAHDSRGRGALPKSVRPTGVAESSLYSLEHSARTGKDQGRRVISRSTE
jgi:hypothetical protein